MNTSFVYDQDGSIRHLISTYGGVVTYTDILDHFRRRAETGTLGYDHLADLTFADVRLTSTEAERLLAEVRKISAGHDLGKTALLVTRDVDFGTCRMWSAFADGYYTVRPFRNRQEALQWLGWNESAMDFGQLALA